MARKLTPAKRHAIRAQYEAMQKERRNERLGIKPKKTNKKGKRR
jgi:hypothetical protein